MSMDDAQRKRLDDHSVIILPEDIDHSVYELILDAVLIAPDREIELFCNGSGGASRDAIAIAGLIHEHGHFVGMLTGEAHSSHAVIFASCQSRFIYPNALIGVHMVAWSSISTRVDAKDLALMAHDYQYMDERNSEILADASVESPEYWYKAIRSASGTTRNFNHDQIIQLGLALSIDDKPHEQPQNNIQAREHRHFKGMEIRSTDWMPDGSVAIKDEKGNMIRIEKLRTDGK